MGFSLMEMLVVVVIIGMMSMFIYPRVETMWSQTQVRGARTAVLNMVNAAKISARTANTSAALIVNNNHLRVDRGGVTVFQQNLESEFKVGVRPAAAQIDFDPRGLTSGGVTIVVARSGFSDSVVIDGYGRVRR